MDKYTKWKIFYDDGTTFCDEDGGPSEAPGLGVQIIKQYFPDHRDGIHHLKRYAYYVRLFDRWTGMDLFGLFDYLFSIKCDHPKAALAGRIMLEADFISLHSAAKEDDYIVS